LGGLDRDRRRWCARAFAVYTFGWHRRHSATSSSVKAEMSRQEQRLIKLEATATKDSRFLNDVCGDYRASRDSVYSKGEDRDIRYFVAVVRSWGQRLRSAQDPLIE
jgi:hypothetical protein